MSRWSKCNNAPAAVRIGSRIYFGLVIDLAWRLRQNWFAFLGACRSLKTAR